MLALIGIGFVCGLVTGASPFILPTLPAMLTSASRYIPGMASATTASGAGSVGVNIGALTLPIAVGTALTLLFFALAGRRVAEWIGVFRRRPRTIRIVAWVITLLLAVGPVFNLPAAVQRAIPSHTHALQKKGPIPGQFVPADSSQFALVDLACSDGERQLQNCGTAPDFSGIKAWFNTPGGAPISLQSLRGKVVLVDFWAYSCINCQRAIPHIVDWYRAYHGKGLEVVGVHTPEYPFERVEDNVRAGAADLGITYPVALDNDYATWMAYQNIYWPAVYLIDAHGNIRHTKFGEGDYDVTEHLIQQLLSQANTASEPPPQTR